MRQNVDVFSKKEVLANMRYMEAPIILHDLGVSGLLEKWRQVVLYDL